MQPRSIGIIAGGGGPLGASHILREIISECQKTYKSWRSYEYPAMNFFSYPYSEMLLSGNNDSIPSRELSYSIQQLKLMGMEIVVVPCFTMSSYITFHNYGVELIEMGPVVQEFLKNEAISNPIVICSERTRKSQYCDKFFECQYPSYKIQTQITILGEKALRGETVDLNPIIEQLPKETPILCAFTVLNAQGTPLMSDCVINPNIILAKYVVNRSFSVTSNFNYIAQHQERIAMSV